MSRSILSPLILAGFSAIAVAGPGSVTAEGKGTSVLSDAIRGSWTLERYEENGVKDELLENHHIEFRENAVVKWFAPEVEFCDGTYKVGDIVGGGNQLDLRWNDGDGRLWKCLAKIAEGKLYIVLNSEGNDRPKEIVLKSDDTRTIMILHRGR